VLAPGEFAALLDRIASREMDPYTAVDQITTRSLSSSAEGYGGPAEAFREGGTAPTGRRTELDHVGIAVGDLAAAVAFYRDALGLEIEAPEEVASQRVRAHFIPVVVSEIELLEGTAEDSPITKYVAKRGPGIHHLTLRVPDIRAALARLKEKGVRLIDESPREGAHGSLVAFIHPSSTHGVLVELKQRDNR
jgi:methylmalonyl-CoA/ethylmalonyl-CoA epimerase